MDGYLDFRRSITSVRLMVDYGLEHGVAIGEMLEGSQISPALLMNPNTEITASLSRLRRLPITRLRFPESSCPGNCRRRIR